MPLSKLTQHARSLIKDLALTVDTSDVSLITVGEVLTQIKKSEGLGAVVLGKFSKLSVDRNIVVDLDLILKEAYYQASVLEHSYVGTEHILLAILKQYNSVDYSKVKKHLLSLNLFPKALNLINEKHENFVLDTYGKNLNKEVFKLYKESLLPRKELNNLVSVLLKKDNANVLLVGDPGVGKRSLISLLVASISSLDVPTLLAGHQVYEFDLIGYLTGIANKGNIDQNLLLLQEELKSFKRVILSLKNFQNLFVSNNGMIGVPILLPIFKDILEDSKISFIATMNTSVYEKLVVENSHLLESFTVIEVLEPDEPTILKMLESKATILGDYHNIKTTSAVLDYIYRTARNSNVGISFPQRAIDLLDLACAHLLVSKNRVPSDYKDLVDKTIDYYGLIDKNLSKGSYERALKYQKEIDVIEKKLTAYENKMVIADPIKLTKLDVDTILRDMDFELIEEPVDTNYLSSVQNKIKKHIIGQSHAVENIVKALIRARLGLRDKNRPIGNFLFLGPTGVGKTELAKVLSKYAFGEDTKNHLIRLDMSDFSEKHTVARLVGSPPGYVGYNEGGELTSKIEIMPESVVLFDEIEKAHPDVLNILLQITEEGELADAKGNTFDFSKAIIILTSNLGTEILHNKEIGFKESIKDSNDNSLEKHLKQNLKKIMRPELLNRFDEVVVFKRLAKKDQLEILDILLQNVDNKLSEQEVFLTVTKKVKTYLLEKGYSQEYGARSLRRTVEKEILDRVAEILLQKTSRPLFLKTYVTPDSIEIRLKD